MVEEGIFQPKNVSNKVFNIFKLFNLNLQEYQGNQPQNFLLSNTAYSQNNSINQYNNKVNNQINILNSPPLIINGGGEQSIYESTSYYPNPTEYLISNNQNNMNDNINYINNNTINNENTNNIDNQINNKINNKKEKEKEEDIIEDPDEILFRKGEQKEDNPNEEDEGSLSSESDKNSYNEKDFKDHLLAQYEKVKRVKNRWKVYLKGCVVQKDKKEYICGKINGDLEREW